MRAGRVGPALAVLIAAAVCSAAAPGSATAQQARVQTILDTTLVTVGDRLELTVRVEHAPGQTVAWPDSLSLEPFEILGAELVPPTEVDGRVVSAARFTLTTFELGDLEIPSFDVSVAGPDGSATVVSTDAFGVTVRSVGLDEGGDIRDIRGPLGIPIGLFDVLPWLLLLLALGLVVFWLWRRWRRGAEVAPRRSVAIPRLPHEEAYDALARLEASTLLERGEIKQYHIEVSEIIRTYVEGRFDIFALEMTTGEVVEGLRETGVDSETFTAFDDFLSRCDLVKFAKVRPTPDACRQMVATARELVDRTRPVVEAPRSGPDGPVGLDGRAGGDAPAGSRDERGPEEPLLETAGAEEG